MITSHDDVCKAIELLEEALKTDALGICKTKEYCDMSLKDVKKIITSKNNKVIPSDKFIEAQTKKNYKRAKTLLPNSDDSILTNKKKANSEDINTIIKSIKI